MTADTQHFFRFTLVTAGSSCPPTILPRWRGHRALRSSPPGAPLTQPAPCPKSLWLPTKSARSDRGLCGYGLGYNFLNIVAHVDDWAPQCPGACVCYCLPLSIAPRSGPCTQQNPHTSICVHLHLQAMLNQAVQLLVKDPALTARALTVNAVCPGWCRTRMGGDQAPKTPAEGAESVFWAVVNGGPGVNGGFYASGSSQSW